MGDQDQTALIKEIEGRVTEYMALLKPVLTSCSEGGGESVAGTEVDLEASTETDAGADTDTKADKKKEKDKKSAKKGKKSEPEDVSPHYSTLTHPLVQQCEVDGYAVVRMDVNSLPPPPGTEEVKEQTESDKEKEKEKGKTTRKDKEEGEKEDDGAGQQEKVSESVNPTSAVVTEIYERCEDIQIDIYNASVVWPACLCDVSLSLTYLSIFSLPVLN